jgi:hypothetical protein
MIIQENIDFLMINKINEKIGKVHIFIKFRKKKIKDKNSSYSKKIYFLTNKIK